MTKVMFRTIAIAGLLLSAIPAAAQTSTTEPARPYLKRSAVITGDLVRIGDLVENAGVVADVAIFRAPDLGETGSVPAARVVQAVRAHQIVGLDTQGVTEVTVSRPSRVYAIKDLQAKIASVLSEQYSLGETSALAINFERGLRTVNVDPAAGGDIRVVYSNYDQRSGRFDLTLEFPGLRPQRFTGTAVAAVEIVTLARPVNRGEVLRHSDLVVERRAKSEIGREAISSPDMVVGRAARGTLRAGQPLRAADLMKPELVQRDGVVTLIYQTPGVVLTMRGKANEGGAEGDFISVTNLQSKRVVQGTVTENGSVIVGTALPRVVANLDSADDASKNGKSVSE